MTETADEYLMWDPDAVEFEKDQPTPPPFPEKSAGGHMLHKTFDLLDAKADSEAGTFEATVAVFGNVDKGGDRVLRGAFKNTLAKWADSGDPIPVILSHQWNNPMAHIGIVEDAYETDAGLRVRGKLDVEDNDVARQVHKLMMRRSLKEFSFGYSVPQGGSKRTKDGINDLTEIDLAEVGPTLKGMNPATELHAVKSALDEEAPAPLSPDELRKAATDAARQVVLEAIPQEKPPPAEPDEVKAAGPGARGAIQNLVRYYAGKPHPFTECVRDNTKRFGEDRAKRICATLKRMGGRKAAETPDDIDWVQELYDAAGGDFEGLIEMYHAYLTANGEKADEILFGGHRTADKEQDTQEKDAEPGRRTHSDPLKDAATKVAQQTLIGTVREPQPKPEPRAPEQDPDDLKADAQALMLAVMTGRKVSA